MQKNYSSRPSNVASGGLALEFTPRGPDRPGKPTALPASDRQAKVRIQGGGPGRARAGMSAGLVASLNLRSLFGSDGPRPRDLAGLHASRRRFAVGERIYPIGEDPPFVFLIESGAIDIVLRSGSGRWVINRACDGDIFGEMRPVGLTMLGTYAEAASPSSLLRLDAAASLELMRRAAVRWSALQAPVLYDCLVDRHRIKFATTESRLALMLLALAGDDRLVTRVTQQDIADRLGLAREGLWPVLDRLRREGLLEWRRSAITLLDVEGLRRYASLWKTDVEQAPG
jgi:CRP-like cAMP-binding protein